MRRKEKKTNQESKKRFLICTSCGNMEEIDFETGVALALLLNDNEIKKVKDGRDYKFLAEGCLECRKELSKISNVKILEEE